MGIFFAEPKRALGCAVVFWNDAAGGDGAASSVTPRMELGLGCWSFPCLQSLGGIWKPLEILRPERGGQLLVSFRKERSGMIPFSSCGDFGKLSGQSKGRLSTSAGGSSAGARGRRQSPAWLLVFFTEGFGQQSVKIQQGRVIYIPRAIALCCA